MHSPPSASRSYDDLRAWGDGQTIFSTGSPPPRPPTRGCGSGAAGGDGDQVRFRGSRRLVDRGGDFHQCKGKISLRKKIKRRDWRSLYGVDLFHSLVNAPTLRICSILLGGYITVIIFFALLYYSISKNMGCNLGLDNSWEAFTFSLETMATIGYGTQDIFFDDCVCPVIVLTVQVCVKMIADAITIGVIYCRLSRPHARASTVIFSDKAVIRRVRGKLYFMFQLCELRKHQLVEAHVRVYAFRNEVDPMGGSTGAGGRKEPEPTQGTEGASPHGSASEEAQTNSLLPSRGSFYGAISTVDDSPPVLAGNPSAQLLYHYQYQSPPVLPNGQDAPHSTNAANSFLQTCTMRLNHPNDELGGMLLLMTPQVVVHELDSGSPLMPPPMWLSNHSYSDFSNAASRVTAAQVVAGDCVRWHPPVYRQFVLPDQHSDEAGEQQYSNYDAEALARMDFPSINRRTDSDFFAFTHQEPPLIFDASTSGDARPPAARQEQRMLPQSRPFLPSEGSQKELAKELSRKDSVSFAKQSNVGGGDGDEEEDEDEDEEDEDVFAEEEDSFNLDLPSSLHFGSFHNLPPPPIDTSRTPMVDLEAGQAGEKAKLPLLLTSTGLRRYYDRVNGVAAKEATPTAAGRVAPPPAARNGYRGIEHNSSFLLSGRRDEHIAAEMSSRVPPHLSGPPSSSAPHSHSSPPTPPNGSSAANSLFAQSFRGKLAEMSSPSAGPRDSSNNSSRTSSTDWQTEERKMVQLFMRDRQVEIIVVVEGVDAATGGMVQARHSYTCDEIEWDKSFVGCVSRDPLDGCTTIDFSRFHDLQVGVRITYMTSFYRPWTKSGLFTL